MVRKSIFAALALSGLAATASAGFKFNEFMINPVGADNGFEWVELISDNGSESSNGLWFIVVEGDFSAGGQTGLVTTAQNLTAAGASGSNKLMLLRDSATALLPAPAAATTIYVEDWNPDIQNGTQTYMLVRNFSGNVGTDLDADNDGVLEILPWTGVDHALGYTDGGATDLTYAGQFTGGVSFIATGFAPQAYSNIPGVGHAVMQVTTTTGPYGVFNNLIADTNGSPIAAPASWTMTPGDVNMGFAQIVNPSGYTVQAGLNFGGSLASLFDSDDNKVVVLCDENEPTGQVQIDFNSVGSPSAMSAKVEAASSRNDCGQFFRAFNYSTSQYDQVDFRITTTADSSFSVSLSPATYSNLGQASVRFVWIPTADIDAGDGWTYSIDRAVIETQ